MNALGAMDVLRRAVTGRLSLARGQATLGSFMEDVRGARPTGRFVDQAAEPTTGVRARKMTVAEAADLVDRWAAGVRSIAGFAVGDRIVLSMPNSVELFLATVATSRAGGVPVPVNDAMSGSEVEFVAADAQASTVVGHADELDALAAGAPDDVPAEDLGAGLGVSALFYTSGTTGKPKGAALSHRSLVGETSKLAVFPAGTVLRELFTALPIAHIYGFAVLAGGAAAGIPIRLRPHFRPDECLDDIETRGISVFAGVPTMYRMLEEAGADERELTSVRVWLSGADVLPDDLANRFRSRGAALTLPGGRSLGDATVAEGYGMVETGGGVAFSVSLPRLAGAGGDRVGVPLPGYHTRVIDRDGTEVRPGEVGELQLRGPGVLSGYWGDRAATEAVLDRDGWLSTGDLVRRGPLGTFSFHSRAKAVVKSGGFSVYPPEVEARLEAHPDVLEAGVTGVPDDRLGERVVAAVALRPAANVSMDELRDWASEGLSEYKVPSIIIEADELPRTGTGKLQRHALSQRFERHVGD